MNRDEILEKSRKENKGNDERERVIQVKANSLSQGTGMVLCIVIGFLGYVLTNTPDFLWCGLSIHSGMFACERIACAVRYRSVGQWLFAGILTIGFVAAMVGYVLCLLNIV